MTGAITAELLKVPLNRGRAILATVASINPAAAAAISQHAAQRRQVAVVSVEGADRDDQNHRRAEQSRQRRERAERPANARAENHREVDHVAAGQEGAQRKSFVELIRSKPAPPLHHDPPRPGEDAAKAGQRDRGKGQEQFGNVWLRRGSGLGVWGGCWRGGGTGWGTHRSHLTHSGFSGQPGGCAPAPGLFSATICAYIVQCRRNPAMAINGRRNKPFGPGGSTRRLHQFRSRSSEDSNQRTLLITND